MSEINFDRFSKPGEIEDLSKDSSKDSSQHEQVKDLRTLQKQLDVIRYSPLLFQSILEEYEVDFKVMDLPIEELLLHMNHGGVLTKVICKWRFSKGV